MTCLMLWLPTTHQTNVSYQLKPEPTGSECCFTCTECIFACVLAERTEERAAVVPGGQDLCQILQDVGDDVYQQYRLTRQGSDFDSQSAFHINVSFRFFGISQKITCVILITLKIEACLFLSVSSIRC